MTDIAMVTVRVTVKRWVFLAFPAMKLVVVIMRMASPARADSLIDRFAGVLARRGVRFEVGP